MEGGSVRIGASGLEGHEVASTALSHVDGGAGRLVVAGHDVERLAAGATFEDVLGLLWEGRLPGADERLTLRRALGRARVQAFGQLSSLGGALHAEDAMDGLRAAVAHQRATRD